MKCNCGKELESIGYSIDLQVFYCKKCIKKIVKENPELKKSDIWEIDLKKKEMFDRAKNQNIPRVKKNET